MTPDENITLYSNEYRRFQTFKNQLQNKFLKSCRPAGRFHKERKLHADVEYSNEDDEHSNIDVIGEEKYERRSPRPY